MPRFETVPGMELPKNPCMAFLYQENSFVVIPPGSTLAIIEDPTSTERVWLLTLLKVSHREIELQCACRRPRCTRTLKLKAIWKGQHPRVNEK